MEVSFLHMLYEFYEIKLNVMKYASNCVSWNSLKNIFYSVSSPLEFLKIHRKTSVSESYNFIKKETLAQMFSSEFWEISKNTFFIEHLRWLLLKGRLMPTGYSSH